MNVAPPIVKVRFADLATQTNVYPGLTATLKDMRTSLRISLSHSPNDASHIQGATVTIGLADGSNKASSYELDIGHNNIVHSDEIGGDIKYNFEINKTYSIRIVVELSDKDSNDSSVYVGQFTYEDKVNESAYDKFLFRNSETLDQFSSDNAKFKLVEHELFEKDGTIKIDLPIDFFNELDDRKPGSLSLIFDEVDDYPGAVNDSDNTEHTAAYIKVPYIDNGHYEFSETELNGNLENDHAYHILVSAIYADGHHIQKTMDDILHVIVNPKIDVDPYGLGSDETDAGDVNTSTVAILYVEKNTLGTANSHFPAKDQFTVTFSQGDTTMYSGALNVADGVEITRGGKQVLEYTITHDNVPQVEGTTPVAESDEVFVFDVQITVYYDTLPGTSIASISKPSNVVNARFVDDYVPISSVYIANAWMAATGVDATGDREVNMTNQNIVNAYTDAPDIGIVGSFYKTNFFGNGRSGLLKDLDTVDTKFKYEISVSNGDEGEEEVWTPVQNIHQIQGDANKSLQENYVDVIAASMQSNDDGEYANIQYTGTTLTNGSLQPAMYFRVCATPTELFSEDQIVKVRVTIVTPNKSTDVGSKESNVSVVVKKISKYTMTAATASEPLFTGSGADGVLAIPINVEESGADLHFVSARFQSNDFTGANADITQTDADDADQNEGDDSDDDNDNVFDLTVSNPSKRGVGADNAINYTVSYKINDPNGGTVSIKSASYAINVTDEPTSSNYSITNHSYKTFNDEGESSFMFDVSFTDGDSTGIDGVNVYFQSSNNDDDDSNDISPMLVMNVPRTNGDSQSNLSVMLQDTPASISDVSITVNDIDGNDSKPWMHYRSGTISFVPYKSPRVFGSIIVGDDLIESNDPAEVDTKPILHIPVIEMPENVQLVSGVVESHNGTQLTWSNHLGDYSNTLVVPSYDLMVNGVNKSGEVVVDVDDSSKRSYSVDVTDPLHAFSFELRTKLASNVDNTVYYSKPVVVEFTSASVDLSSATAVVKRGSSVTTLKGLINAYEKTDPSDIVAPTGVTVFVEPNYVAPSFGWQNPSYVLVPGDHGDVALANLGLNDHVKSIRIPQGFTVQVWNNNFSGTTATYTSDVAQTINSVSSLRITGSAAGFPKESNLIVDELKLVDNAGVNACVSQQSGQQTLLTDAQIDGVIADSNPIISVDPEVDGWNIKNTYADGAATRPKVNLYYYANPVASSIPTPAPNGDGLDASNSFTLSQATGLGLYAIFYQNQGAKEYPFFNAYTAKTTSGTNKSWYKSKVFYGSESDQGDTTTDSNKAGLTLVYTGTDNGLLFPEITRRVKYVVKVGTNLTNANTGYESEAVWLLSLQTSGAATSSSESFNFRLLEAGMFTGHSSFGQLSLRFNVMLDPVRVKVLPCSSTNADVQEVGGAIHTYDLSGTYEKSDTLHLLVRMKAGVKYTEKRGDAVAEDKESESMYLRLVPEAKVAYTCASRPSVEVVGTRNTGTFNNIQRQVINLKINANGLKREGFQSIIISLLKEGDHTDEASASGGSEIVLSFESTNERVRSYIVDEDGADVTIGSTDNLGAGEHHELLNNDVDGFSETALPLADTFVLVMGTLDDDDESKLYFPEGSEWDSGDMTVLAVASTRIGTDVDYGTVTSS
jgi:hypothetical protein